MPSHINRGFHTFHNQGNRFLRRNLPPCQHHGLFNLPPDFFHADTVPLGDFSYGFIYLLLVHSISASIRFYLVYQQFQKYATAYTLVRIRYSVFIVMIVLLNFTKKAVRAIIKDAVVARFRQLCEGRGISYTELSRLAGVTPSTVYSMLGSERKDVGISTIKKLCDGLELDLLEFFDCDLFHNLPPEIE